MVARQMHGIVWWRSASVLADARRLLAEGGGSAPVEYAAWSTLVTWQDQRCTPAFLQQCSERVAEATLASNSTASPLATGYGLATYAHTLATAPEKLLEFDACGTIQDFVAFVLCGHTSAQHATIDTTNAFSWGGFDLQHSTWNRQAFVAAMWLACEWVETRRGGCVC